MTVWRAHSESVTSLLWASGCDGCTSITSSSCPSTIDPRPRLGGLEREDAEVEAALRHLGADLAGRNAAHVHVHQRVRLSEARDERQHGVHRRFVGADQHPAAPQVAQVLDRAFGFLGQAEQALGVVAQQAAGVGEGGVLGGAVEQPLADALLEPADRLADGRLRPVQLHGGPGEAAFGGDLEKDA